MEVSARLNIIEKLNINIALEGFGERRFSKEAKKDLMTDIDHLGVYLIQKSFVTTVRTLAKSAELVSKYKQRNAIEIGDQVEAQVKIFIRDTFGYEKYDVDGAVIETNKENVVTLFNEIKNYLFIDADDDEDDQAILERLKGYQRRYLDILLDLVIDRSADLQTFGEGSLMQKADERLLKLEKGNIQDLYDTVMARLDENGNSEIRDLAYTEQKFVVDGIFESVEGDVEQFTKAPAERNAGTIQQKLQSIFKKSEIDIAEQDVVTTEMLLIAITNKLHRAQQIIILTDLLNQINEFHHTITQVEIDWQAEGLSVAAKKLEEEAKEANKEATQHRKSKRFEERTLGRFEDLNVARRSSQAARNIAMAEKYEDLQENFDSLRTFFAQKGEHATRILTTISGLLTYVKKNRNTIVLEAGKNDALFTSSAVVKLQKDMEEIQNNFTNYHQSAVRIRSRDPRLTDLS